MESLEELLYSSITGNTGIQTKLATFASKPAVFERQAPGDEDTGWTSAQYPRINYVIDRRDDPERKVSGMAVFEIWSTNEISITPEEIEADIKGLLDGTVFHPGGEPVTAMKWDRTEAWEAKQQSGGTDILVIGTTVAFDLIAFPAQTTTAPDPVAVMNEWATANFQELQVDPQAWTPTQSRPALYWRLSGLQVAQQLNSFAWMECTLIGHILAKGPTERLPVLKQMVEKLAKTRRLYMEDGSPMFIQTIRADSAADPFRQGHISLIVRYGVLYDRPEGIPLMHANMSGGL